MKNITTMKNERDYMMFALGIITGICLMILFLECFFILWRIL